MSDTHAEDEGDFLVHYMKRLRATLDEAKGVHDELREIRERNIEALYAVGRGLSELAAAFRQSHEDMISAMTATRRVLRNSDGRITEVSINKRT